MCGRYANHCDQMGRWGEILQEWPADAPTGYNVAPTQTVPVFAGPRGVGMRWGLIPHWAGEPETRYSTYNARVESVAVKPAFRHAWQHGRRCLIPALGWYEWRQEDGRKIPWFIRAVDDGPLVFAGIWERWEDKTFGGELLSCAIITRAAEPEIEFIHPRMPLLLTPELATAWLEGSAAEAAMLLHSGGPVSLRWYRVDQRVNNARSQGRGLVEAIGLGRGGQGAG